LRRTKRKILPTWLSIALIFTMVMTGLVVSLFVFLTAEAFLNRPLNPLPAEIAEVIGTALPPLSQVGTVEPPTVNPGEPTPTLLPPQEPWQGTDRVNILVMGIDRRPGEPFISRTDTMMLMSLDPATETASILSIPRDLYVVIPGFGRDRINTAFVYGSQGNNPEAGAQLAMQTVEYNLGVPVNHYVMVDFSAVVNGIDALGGLDIYVPTDIYDPTYPDMNYGYDPLYIPAGQHHFDGLTALKYARTRHQDSDFGRAQRQQAVVLALRQQVLNRGFASLLLDAPNLYRQVEEGVRTDLSLDQLLRLAQTASQVEDGKIYNDVLDYRYVSSYTTEAGAAVLILNNEAAAPLIRQLFYGQ
jgi:polyisoprenyl-teichoic acid--peptidoglycan teichoic acid transferase